MSNNKYSGCYAVLGTLSSAQKAQRALSAAAISTVISKSESSLRRGCMWSINFSCNQMENVRSVLASSGIKVKLWSGENDIS